MCYTSVSTLGSPVPADLFSHARVHRRTCVLDFASVHVDTSLSDTSSRAHLSVVAPVVLGESSGQRIVDVSDSPAPYLVTPVPIGANLGQRIVDGSDSHIPSVTAPTGARFSAQRRGWFNFCRSQLNRSVPWTTHNPCSH